MQRMRSMRSARLTKTRRDGGGSTPARAWRSRAISGEAGGAIFTAITILGELAEASRPLVATLLGVEPAARTVVRALVSKLEVDRQVDPHLDRLAALRGG